MYVKDQHSASPSHIRLWRLRADAIHVIENNRFKVLVPPHSSNKYRRAQRGLFTWDSQFENEVVITGKSVSMEDVVARDIEKSWQFDEVLMDAIDVPIAEAWKLQSSLEKEGITRAHLMPTLDNVAKRVKDRAPLVEGFFWQRD